MVASKSRLISRAVAKAYGVFVAATDGGYASRSTFIVDKAGKIAWVSRDFPVPKMLDGTTLLAALDALTSPTGDPASALEKLTSPEREGRTIVVRWLQAMLREDILTVQSLLHPDYGWRATEPTSTWKTRREAEVARTRKVFEAVDLRATTFDAILDPKAGRALAKGDSSKPGGSGGLTDTTLKASMALAEGDLLIVIPTKTSTLKDAKGVDVEILPKSIAHVLRKDGETWRILEVVR